MLCLVLGHSNLIEGNMEEFLTWEIMYLLVLLPLL